ncbi:MAG TPA: DUF1990 domain-containing protein [Gemmatimonadaceae bacterium]|nr:DUF1990 domain-containing protein [Gemmatimonadaceae bacterium]
MFSITRPAAERIARFLAAQEDAPFSYAEVGATRDAPPPLYTVDHNRVRLGSGIDVFDRAAAALRGWRMLTLGWAGVYPQDTAIAPGRTVAVVARHYGFWSLNACRIVYVVDEAGGADGMRRFGFAYGTLPDHGAVGEERFMIEWRPADDSVWYDLYAVSRPGHPLARLGYPLVRALQRRFARASKQAMVSATADFEVS